jgi:hypothetical protein
MQLSDLAATVEGAAISSDAKQRALWCLGQMSAQYDKLLETYDSRYADEVFRLARGLLENLAGARAAAVAAVAQLQALHERLGLQPLDRKKLLGKKAA